MFTYFGGPGYYGDPTAGTHETTHPATLGNRGARGRTRNRGPKKTYVNIKDNEIIGIKDASLRHQTKDARSGSLTQETFDTTTYADGAIILLKNSTGTTKIVINCSIYGKAVVRLSGDSGFLHDKFTDWERVAIEGEVPFEIGNNYIVESSQVNKIADWWWKWFRVARHDYVITRPGTWYHVEPGETYTLQIGSAGDAEYVDATVRCIEVTIDRGAGDLGETSIRLREVQSSWKYDSTALARFLVGGSVFREKDFETLLVADKDYCGSVSGFAYCDGTADDVEIQAAIDHLNAVGGGVVTLAKGGTFVVSTAIALKSNVILRGNGATIQKELTGAAITATGSAGSELENLAIEDVRFSAGSGDTAQTDTISFDYVKSGIIKNVGGDDYDSTSIDVSNSIGVQQTNLHFRNAIPATGAEYWDLSIPDCKSSLMRSPSEKSIVYEPAHLYDEVRTEYDNAWAKFTGRGVVGVFQATTNLVTDPEDLTTSNWTFSAGASASLSDYYWNGRRFTKVTSDGSSSSQSEYVGVAITGATASVSITLKHYDSTTTSVGIYDTTDGWKGLLRITWSSKTVSVIGGSASYTTEWYGDDILILRFIVSAVAAHTNMLYIYPTYDTTEAKSILVTAAMVEDLAYPTPYTPTARPSGALVAPFSWDQQGTIEFWLRPWFIYDVGADKYFIADFDGGSWHFAWRYSAADDKWKIAISDGTTSIVLYSSQITSNADLWKWWHLKATWDTVNDSYKFWVDGALVDSSTTALSAISFNDNISIGSIPKYTSPAGYQADALITDLQYKSTVDETTTHYDNGAPYYDPDEETW